MCEQLPILSQDAAKAFFTQAESLSNEKGGVVERRSGKLLESMAGFVSVSDRNDFSASYSVSDSRTPGYGVLMVETYDSVMPVTFCVARVSEDRFLTEGWIGDKERQGIEGLRSVRAG
jgi:hypothetical protein